MGFKVIELVIGSQEWLDYRREKIGASQSSAILGISPFQTPLELYNEKIHGMKKDFSFSMQRGLEREKEALDWAEIELGVSLRPKIVEHTNEWKFATLDGVSEDFQTAVEVKWAKREVHELAKQGKVIDYYYPQLQSQMFCLGIKEMHFLSCYEEKGQLPDFFMIKIKMDEEFINMMLKEEEIFYTDNFIRRIPPDPMEKDYIPVHKDFMFDMLCDRDKEFADKIKVLEEQRSEIRNQIIDICRGHNSKSSQYKVTKSYIKGRVDYDKACEGIDIEKFRKPGSESWRISKI